MSESQNPMDVLNALMEERARYEQWLAHLDARRGTTPPHVFERVRGDYGDRLKSVLDQLAGRATELQVTAGTLADRVASLYFTKLVQRQTDPIDDDALHQELALYNAGQSDRDASTDRVPHVSSTEGMTPF